jgi:hypothetical protein
MPRLHSLANSLPHYKPIVVLVAVLRIWLGARYLHQESRLQSLDYQVRS